MTQRYLILIEPDYDLFSDEQKKRMDEHGYCKYLYPYLCELGANILHYGPWGFDSNDLNKASIIIVEKSSVKLCASPNIEYVSPISLMPLMKGPHGFYCKEDGHLFPVVNDIPVLLKKNAILISHYHKFYTDVDVG